MSKKNYMAPTVKVHRMEQEEIMAASGGLSTDTRSAAKQQDGEVIEAGARPAGMSVWDD